MNGVKGLDGDKSCDGAVTGEGDRHEINQWTQRDVQVRLGLAVDVVMALPGERVWTWRWRSVCSSPTGKTRSCWSWSGCRRTSRMTSPTPSPVAGGPAYEPNEVADVPCAGSEAVRVPSRGPALPPAARDLAVAVSGAASRPTPTRPSNSSPRASSGPTHDAARPSRPRGGGQKSPARERRRPVGQARLFRAGN